MHLLGWSPTARSIRRPSTSALSEFDLRLSPALAAEAQQRVVVAVEASRAISSNKHKVRHKAMRRSPVAEAAGAAENESTTVRLQRGRLQPRRFQRPEFLFWTAH